MRIMVAVAHADVILNRKVLAAYRQITAADDRLGRLTIEEFKHLIRQQSCILHADRGQGPHCLEKADSRPAGSGKSP